MQTVKTKYFEYGQEEMDYLTSVDVTLGVAIARMGKVERVIIPDLFTALVYAIVGQLISVKAVHKIWTRIQDRFGEITPQNIAIQTADDIQRCGMTMKKAVCIQNVARMIEQGAFDLDELYVLSDGEVVRKLITLNGVGKWTAEMMLINAMERPDVISWGDIAIRRGMMKLYGLSELSQEQFEEYRLRYSPLGSVASIYLWTISFE
ncbi:DNA-3-methyladenine glycosylase family protein [Paenibacillus sp. IHBB 10380]|uniref:DNA-3-methyladenine glycosylase family protein n=1 Tax=Paenibacillus sp. IHBB 10380 TaxID=1566358 RepID=UPI0005CFEF08|nr:DNA-3-methyladenine glycosylase [Paenibacillus sp. IHBB 10380]AJS61621.1 DNA-3-methyladenine glycosidase [Paenibacillus sp. IHBB 10380]